MSNSILPSFKHWKILILYDRHQCEPWHIVYGSYVRISNTNASLVKLVHICSCCKLDQQATATFGFKKEGRWQSQIIVVKYLKGKSKNLIISTWKAAEGHREYHKIWQCVIDANFMTLELYYNTEEGAVIDRNKDTRCITICICGVSISQYAFWRIVAPLKITDWFSRYLMAVFQDGCLIDCCILPVLRTGRQWVAISG